MDKLYLYTEELTGVDLLNSKSETRNVFARAIYCRIASELLGISDTELGNKLNKSRGAIYNYTQCVFPSIKASNKEFYNIYLNIKHRMMDGYYSTEALEILDIISKYSDTTRIKELIENDYYIQKHKRDSNTVS